MEKKLLIVDDSRLSRMMIGAIVKEYGCDWSFVEAASADEALVQAKAHTINAVTLDMNMPGRSGLEIAPELKEIVGDIEIALVTANVQKSVKEQAENLGLSFISKPVTEEKIVSYLNRVDSLS